MRFPAKTQATMGLLAVLVAMGVAAWVYQLMKGLGVTGMSNATSWGLYIVCFMFFVGLSAGGLIVASSASVFNVADYKKVALPAVILSTACICVAGMFILVDLGGIQRVWRLLASPNVRSPLVWDVFVISCYLVINVLYLVFMHGKNSSPRKVAIISRFALPVAILVHSVTAWIFGLQIAREGWYSALLAPLFIASALTSGLALLLLVLGGLNKSGLFKIEKKLMTSLAGLLAACIAVDGFLVASEVLTMAYPGAAGAETLKIMTSGATAPFFWLEIVVGIVVPFCILVFAKARAKTGLVMVASACVVAGVFCMRIWLLLTSFRTLNISGAPGVSLGTRTAQEGGAGMWALVGSYAPTGIEIAISIGIIALGAFIFLVVGTRLLPGAQALSPNAEKEPVKLSTDSAAAVLE